MNILVCGGAGYIGSHMVKMLVNKGYNVIVFDNLSTGHREAIRWGSFIKGDLIDETALHSLFQSHSIDAVMHFSARSLVGESMTSPHSYYRNNVIGTFNLLEAMRKNNVTQIVFSSTAAVYGDPAQKQIDERHPLAPINPYGQTKLMVEHMLKDYAQAYQLNSVSLRYFNAAGADPEGIIGESHCPETHLIPNILESVIHSQKTLTIFGNDYDTADGTCIRDYIHVQDLCAAHLNALQFIDKNPGPHAFNLGNGNGFSIMAVLQAAEAITGRTISYEISKRRPGDPSILVADSTRARQQLAWIPEFVRIEEIIETAWKWHTNKSY